MSGDDLALSVWLGGVILGYLLGSIPFGLVLGWLGGYGDIRKIGSGNIGATNVLRTGNKSLAFCTLVLDSGKGGGAVLAAAYLSGHFGVAVVAGVAAVFGHNFPIWLKFKGGKGIATTLGTLLVVAWPVGLGACITWLVVAAVSRMSSLAGLISLSLAPAYGWFLVPAPHNVIVTYAAAVLAVLSILRHRTNIKRILAGEEPKIGARKEETADDTERPSREKSEENNDDR